MMGAARRTAPSGRRRWQLQRQRLLLRRRPPERQSPRRQQRRWACLCLQQQLASAARICRSLHRRRPQAATVALALAAATAAQPAAAAARAAAASLTLWTPTSRRTKGRGRRPPRRPAVVRRTRLGAAAMCDGASRDPQRVCVRPRILTLQQQRLRSHQYTTPCDSPVLSCVRPANACASCMVCGQQLYGVGAARLIRSSTAAAVTAAACRLARHVCLTGVGQVHLWGSV